MLDTFPRLVLKENRKIGSKEEALLWIEKAKEAGKVALYALYSFREWRDGRPIPTSVVLDVVAFTGEKENLDKIASNLLAEGKESLLLYDGEVHLLIAEHDQTPLEEVQAPPGVEVIRDPLFRFTYPNTPNGKTGEISRILRRYRK